MAGHSHSKNIMYRKGAQDAKRAKIFTKLIRELTVAAKQGEEVALNPRLRAAVLAAREANMPKDTMERAIQRGAGGTDLESYEEIRYEGYGPGGVALIVEVLTDNRNRTAPDLRSIFSKHGGTLGETGSVSFQFDHQGLLEYPRPTQAEEDIFAAAIDLGAEDVEITPDLCLVFTTIGDLHGLREGLSSLLGEPTSLKRIWKPKVYVPTDEAASATLLKLVHALEDNDDVQNVFSNADIAPDVLERLSS